ncbi:hypothetical protein BBJ28_00015242 [Nothophytophthora sp. Chile5]|nr:hypothetical protein BBJ28_00015242 [Nothophytophthora sp. Chile5]
MTVVSDLVADDNKLDPTKKVAAVFGGDLGQETIHVLVQLLPSPLSREEVSVAVLRQQRATEQLARASQIPLKRKRGRNDLNLALLPKRKKEGAFLRRRVLRHVDEPPPIEDDAFKGLTKTVTTKLWVYHKEKNVNEATRVQFMSAIFEHIVYMFRTKDKKADDLVARSVQKNLAGEYVKTNGVFDFLITRGDKLVYAVEAKKEQFEEGSAQDVLSMEVCRGQPKGSRVRHWDE